MKAWLKGGLIGLIVWVGFFILDFVINKLTTTYLISNLYLFPGLQIVKYFSLKYSIYFDWFMPIPSIIFYILMGTLVIWIFGKIKLKKTLMCTKSNKLREEMAQGNFEQPKKSLGLKVFIIGIVIVLLIVIAVVIYFTFFRVNVPEGAVAFTIDGQKVYCIDSDGGVDLSTKGTLKLYNRKGEEIKDPEGEVYQDSCFGGNQIIEYYCNPGDIEELYDCPNECKNGICL